MLVILSKTYLLETETLHRLLSRLDSITFMFSMSLDHFHFLTFEILKTIFMNITEHMIEATLKKLSNIISCV